MHKENQTSTTDKPVDATFKKAQQVEVAASDDSRPPLSPAEADVKVNLASTAVDRVVVISTIVRRTSTAVAFRRASDALRGTRSSSASDTRARRKK
jgi:hypothetical protein